MSEIPKTGFCVVCQVDREIVNPEVLEMPAEGGGERVVKGVCGVCGTGIYSIPS